MAQNQIGSTRSALAAQMKATPIKIVFSGIEGQPKGVNEKERRSHAALSGARGKLDDGLQESRQSRRNNEPPKPRKQAIYRLSVKQKSSKRPSGGRGQVKHDIAVLSTELVVPRPQVLNGNSDPFAGLAIEVTPLTNRVLTFMREALYPALYFNKFFRRMYGDSQGHISMLHDSTWLPAQMAKQGWNFSTGSLVSKGQALACIASFLNNMAALMSDKARQEAYHQALVLTSQSSELLRKALEKAPIQPGENLLHRDHTLVAHVYWLFRAAVHSDNRTSADVHGKILAQTMMQGYDDGVVDLLQIIQATIDDVDDAAMHMRRPHFPAIWFRKAVQGVWTMAEPYIPYIPAELYIVTHPTIHHEVLRELFTTSRHQFAFAADKLQIPDAAWGPPELKQLVYAWFVTKSEYLLMELLTIYFDLLQGRNVPLRSDGTNWSDGDRYTQAGLALGQLYYLRIVGHEAVIEGLDIRDAAAGIMAHLKAILETIAQVTTEAEKQHYAHAHAWLYLIGAFAEERYRTRTYRPPSDWVQQWVFDQHSGKPARWFQHHLAKHIVTCHERGWTPFTQWTEWRHIFAHFQMAYWIQPSGDLWFDRVVEEYVETMDQTSRVAEVLNGHNEKGRRSERPQFAV